MVTQTELAEYLQEIRQNVCRRCVERPEGGPPCASLGKMCGVELHLPELIESIHQVHSNRIQVYLNHNRAEICEKCAFLHSSFCRCPMDYLSVLVVQAVETVDERRGQREEQALEKRDGHEDVELEEIRCVYQEGAGTWTGCDWPTVIGKTGLNLQGWTAAQARAMAQEAEDPLLAEDWFLASQWLTQIERQAQLAEKSASEAVQAAGEGRWRDALASAEWAQTLEFNTGRPLRHGPPLAWRRLREVVGTACRKEFYAACSTRNGTL